MFPFRKTKPILVVIFAACLFAGGCFATEFFIAPNGNDQNPGSLAAPWGTFVKVSDAVAAGDTVTVRGGTYKPAANTYFYKDGTAAAPIIFRAYPGEAVLLDGSALPSGTELIYVSANYFMMQDIELANSKQNGLSIDSGANRTGAGFVTVRNCKIHGSFLAGIAITGGHDVLIDACTIFNNAAMNNVHGGPWTGALYAQDSNNVLFTRNLIYDNQGEGLIFLRSDNCRAFGNAVHDNFSANVYLDNARFCVVDSNFIYTQGDAAYLHDGAGASAVQHANESYNNVNAPNYSSDNRVSNNVMVVLNWNYGFLYSNFSGKGGGLKNFVFANNTIYRKVSGVDPASLPELIHIDQGVPTANDNAVFSDNIFVTESGGKLLGPPTPATGVAFDHNLYFGGEPGLALLAGDLNADPKFPIAGGYSAAGYMPQAGSPAYGAGVAIAGIALDFNGATRGASVDLGAFTSISTVSPPPVTSSALTFSSVPSVAPNPVQAGKAAAMNAFATGTGTLVYTWDLGDGTQMSGAGISKTYSIPGDYACSVTVSNGSASATQPFLLTVTGALFGSSSVLLRLSSKPNSDALLVTGTLALQNGLKPNGDGTVFTLGNFSRALTLNARGASSDRSFKIAARITKGTLAASTVKFTFSVKKQSLAAAFQQFKLNTASGQYSFDTTMSLSLGGYYFFAPQTVNYSVK